jgi:hypothetical protein
MKPGRKLRGVVYKLSTLTMSGPPAGAWQFQLERMDKKAPKKRFSIETDFELWLETIVSEAYKALGRELGELTVVPDRQTMTTFSNVRAASKASP